MDATYVYVGQQSICHITSNLIIDRLCLCNWLVSRAFTAGGGSWYLLVLIIRTSFLLPYGPILFHASRYFIIFFPSVAVFHDLPMIPNSSIFALSISTYAPIHSYW